MDWNLVLLMVGIHALMFLSPGPDSIVVVSRATTQDFRHAFAATLGVISAGFVFVPAVAFGMSIINTLSPAVWMCIRAAGALYLIYIGVNMLRRSFVQRRGLTDGNPSIDRSFQEPLFAAYIQGLLTNLGNPKMVVLLTSFLPQFVAEELGNVSYQILVLGAFMYLNGLVLLTVIALVAVMLKAQIMSRFGSGRLSFWGGSTAGAAVLGVALWMLVAPVRFFMGLKAS